MSADTECSRSDFETFNTCMKNNINTLVQVGTTPGNNLKEQIVKCFEDADCEAPDLDAPEENSQNEAVSALFSGSSQEDVTNCIMDVADNVSNHVDQCVRTNTAYTNFVSLRASEFRGINLQQIFGGQQGNIGRVMESINRCSTADITLFSCLKHTTAGSNLEAKFGQFCNKTVDCVKQLPCNVTLVRGAVCTCVSNHLNPHTEEGSNNIYSYENQLFTSLNRRLPNNRARMAMGSFVGKVVQQICSGDPCAQFKNERRQGSNF